MSYKTNAKSLRLGITHQWFYKAHGPIADFHVDHKIKQYIQNLVEYVVPQAPKNTKTKNKKVKKFPIQPGVQGKTIALRTASEICIISFFYLNYDGATPKQIDQFHNNISRIKWILHEETKCNINIRLINYFMFFWRYEGFLGLARSRRLHKKFALCAKDHSILKLERAYYNLVKSKINKIKRRIPRTFKRQRYYRRSIQPLISSFLFFDFDSDIAAKTVAFELQILRIEHKKFMYYVRRFFKVSFKLWNHYKLMEGMQIKINGRLTNYRRQARRTQTKVYKMGLIKKSNSGCESSHSISVGYNRYGVISVQITYQLTSLYAERWSERSPYSPYNIFSLKEIIEKCVQNWDFNFKHNKFIEQISDNFNIRKNKNFIEKKTINGLNNCFAFYKNKMLKSVDPTWYKKKPVKLRIIYSDYSSYANKPFTSWEEKNNFKKFIKKTN